MAIDLTGSPQPAFGTSASAGTTCTQIRGLPGYKCKIIADGAIYLFNGVEDTGTVAGATERIALSAAEAAQGYEVTFGGKVGAADYATVCVAAQATTVALRASSEPPEGRVI